MAESLSIAKGKATFWFYARYSYSDDSGQHDSCGVVLFERNELSPLGHFGVRCYSPTLHSPIGLVR